MMGNTPGTNDLFGGNPLDKVGRAEKTKKLSEDEIKAQQAYQDLKGKLADLGDIFGKSAI